MSRAPILGEVVTIGKFYVSIGAGAVSEVKVHFMVYEKDGPHGEKGFSGATLELGLFSWSMDAEAAKNQLFTMTEQTVTKLLGDSEGRNHFFTELGDGSLEDFWGTYRQLAFLLGDPERELHRELAKEIKDKRDALVNANAKIIEKDEHMAELRVTLDGLTRAKQEMINA